MQKSNTIFLLLLLMATIAQAQQSVQQLNSYMSSLRGGSFSAVPEAVLRDEANAMALLNALTPYYTDSLERIRSEAYSLSRRIGKGHPGQEVRSKAVEGLVLGLNDVASPVVGNNVAGLTYFRPSDFTPALREGLKTILRPSMPYKGAIAKLFGYLQMQEAKPAMQVLLQEGRPGPSDKWALYLALARMGDQEAMDFILSRVKSLSVNDDLVYDILPDLAYTRQPEMIAYLVEILNSNDKNCEAADAELVGSILCGYRVMEMLAPVIKGFPLASDPTGDLDIEDYEQGLMLAREWFSQHPEYEIIKETF